MLALKRPRRPFKSDQRATTALEFGMVGPIFIIMIILMIETAWQLSVEMALNIGVIAGSRYSITGAGYNNGTRDSAITNALLSISGGILNKDNLSYTSQAYTSPATYASGGTFTSSNGSSGQIVLYKVSYKQQFFTSVPPMILGYNSINHTVTVVAKNEPF